MISRLRYVVAGIWFLAVTGVVIATFLVDTSTMNGWRFAAVALWFVLFSPFLLILFLITPKGRRRL